MNEPETTRPAAAEPAAPEALPDLPCEVCRDLIPLVQDGAASPRSVQLVGRHIEHCESCRAFWQADAPPPAPDDGRVLARIHRRLRLVQIAALAAGTLVGLWLTSFGYAMQWNVVVMPAVGALGALMLRRRWYLVPVSVGIAAFFWHAALENAFNYPQVVGMALYGAMYAGLCLLGAMAAKLFLYAFGKENQDDPQP